MLKNITLSADSTLIAQARKRAGREHRSLNVLFREWLHNYIGSNNAGHEYLELMKQLKHVKARGPYTREEMNER